MERASGLTVTIDDKSVATPGSSSLNVACLALTSKGKLGWNVVTSTNFKEILGWEETNPIYLGIEKLLSMYTKLYVYRLNQKASIANCYIDGNGTYQSYVGLLDFETLTASEPTPKLALGLKSPGDPAKYKVRISQRFDTELVDNLGEDQVFEYSVVDKTAVFDKTSIFDSFKIYDGEGYELLAVVNAAKSKLFRVVSGSITTEEVGTASYNASTHTLTVTVTSSLASSSKLTVSYLDYQANHWTAKLIQTGVQTDTVEESYNFSTKSTDDDFWKEVQPNNFQLFIGDVSVLATQVDPLNLNNGSNGLAENELESSSFDTTDFNNSPCNVILSNTITRIGILNKLLAKCNSLYKHFFVGTPYFKTYEETQSWVSQLTLGMWGAAIAVPNVVTVSGIQVMLCPSIYYGEIYYNMFRQNGNLRFPPAGYTYGLISVEALAETDFALYPDELKTGRINYATSSSSGVCVWEQRTLAPFSTEGSYIAPTFILEDIRNGIIDIERPYNFRYSDPTALNNQQSSLTTWLDSFKEEGFLYDWNMDFPTYEEAQEAGRTLDVHIGVQTTKDAEIIDIVLSLVG